MARHPDAAQRHAPPAVAVVLLCGLPGAGKTTLAGRLVAWLAAETDIAATLLSVDAEEAAASSVASELPAGAGSNGSSATVDGWRTAPWHAARERVQAAVRRAVAEDAQQRAPCRHPRRLLLVDDNHYYASMRRPYYTACRDARAAWGVLWLDAPLSAAAARNVLRVGGARVRDDVMLRMAQRFEPPGCVNCASGALEGACELVEPPHIRCHHHHNYETRHTLRLEAAAHTPADELLDRAWRFVSMQLWDGEMVPPAAEAAPGSTAGGHEAELVEAARAATAASELHAADLQLRRLVRDTVAWAIAAADAMEEAGGCGRVGRGGGEDDALLTVPLPAGSFVVDCKEKCAPTSTADDAEAQCCAAQLPPGLQEALGWVRCSGGGGIQGGIGRSAQPPTPRPARAGGDDKPLERSSAATPGVSATTVAPCRLCGLDLSAAAQARHHFTGGAPLAANSARRHVLAQLRQLPLRAGGDGAVEPPLSLARRAVAARFACALVSQVDSDMPVSVNPRRLSCFRMTPLA